MQKKMEIRHGDVGLVRIDSLPEGAVEEDRRGDIVLARGEATGHAHKIQEKSARIFRVGETRYLVIERPTDLVQTDQTGRVGQQGDGYDLHGAAVVQSGIFEVRIQRVYQRRDVPRRVMD